MDVTVCLFLKYMVIFVIIRIFIVAVLRLEFSVLVYDKQGYLLLVLLESQVVQTSLELVMPMGLALNS